MLLQRFYCEPLAQACYLLASGDEGVVVDPLRDADPVLAFAAARGIRVRWVIATHVHADFVAGLGEVAAKTGARVGLGAHFAGGMACERLEAGREIAFGDHTVRVLATPGHTPDSICLLVDDRSGAHNPRLLTGDTLFVGDVGRPDLATDPNTPPAAMARQLFDSLHQQIAGLADETEIWPAHGAGSACGTAIAAASSSTLGTERLSNWALGERDPDRFCARLLAGLRPPPRYFSRCAALNRDGPTPLSALPTPPTLDAAGVERALAGGATLLDVREWTQHGRGSWPGACNVGLHGGEFEAWAGALLPLDRPIVVHGQSDDEIEQAVRRLRRIGREDTVGATTALPQEPERLRQIDAIDLFDPADAWQVVDVRRAQEFETAHIPGAVHCELGVEMTLADCGLDPTARTALVCEGGYRSSAAAPQFRAAGFTDLHNSHDGMRGWRANHLPTASGADCSE